MRRPVRLVPYGDRVSTTASDSPATPAAGPPAAPAGAEVLAEFCAAGLWPGLGRALARRLLEAGVRRPEDVTRPALAALPGVSAARADRLVLAWADVAPVYAVAELLVPAGLPVRLAGPLVAELGPDAATAVRADPWAVVVVGDATPAQADALAAGLLGRPARALAADERRGRALAAHLVARAARDGHTALPAGVVRSGLAGLGVPDPDAAIGRALDDGRLLAFEDEAEPAAPGPSPAPDPPAAAAVDAPGAEAGPRTLLAVPRYAMAEDAVADGIARLLATAEPLCRTGDVEPHVAELDPAQAAAVAAVAAHGVGVLTGGPGTGKSRTVAAVVALARAREVTVALAAPTGRAAKRLEELTGEPAQTLHRLLGAQGTTGTFLRGESWRLDADVVVVDEASMLDAELAAALLEACDDGTHLLLVGDPAQLPSIGAGRVLGDVIASGAVPVTELTTLHRQAEGGSIARLATAVRQGELPRVDDPTREVVVVAARGSAEAAHRAVQLVTDSIPRVFGLATDEVQVVTPVHRGPAGTMALNAALKERLNPGPGKLAGFDVGDRVVATANHLDEGFANGEVGVVTGADETGLVVTFAGTGPVTVPPKLLGDLRHGWALTVHRAQGSEWPAVVAVLPPEAGAMLSRPLVYTALTRAARHLSVVHAAGPALARGVREVDARPRRTRLTGLLREAAGDNDG
ncbi:MAG: AAA family ATPase [Frankiaceae bacterium]